MFTGIIEATAPVLQKTGEQLTVSRPAHFHDVKTGASISVAGVCLSVVHVNEQSITFTVVDETRNKTTLGGLQEGDVVNLERAMAADGRFDGHVVQGHVEGVGEVRGQRAEDRGRRTEDGGQRTEDGGMLTVQLPDELIKFCVQKGSIALDGVSLTIAELGNDSITVALIPHTLDNTTLGQLRAGDSVNVETDIIGRYVRRSLIDAAS